MGRGEDIVLGEEVVLGGGDCAVCWVLALGRRGLYWEVSYWEEEFLYWVKGLYWVRGLYWVKGFIMGKGVYIGLVTNLEAVFIGFNRSQRLYLYVVL